ncbi:hypothetical protein LY76DRAFT_338486 [Colletotrichum caudatum]|nr:hypothetical protein LY76DRAFT_338486 [Colletotrichum caudatum]
MHIVPLPPLSLLTDRQTSDQRQTRPSATHTPRPPSTRINLLEIPVPCHNGLFVPSAVPGPEGDVPTLAPVRGAKEEVKEAGQTDRQTRTHPGKDGKLLRQKLGRLLE